MNADAFPLKHRDDAYAFSFLANWLTFDEIRADRLVLLRFPFEMCFELSELRLGHGNEHKVMPKPGEHCVLEFGKCFRVCFSSASYERRFRVR